VKGSESPKPNLLPAHLPTCSQVPVCSFSSFLGPWESTLGTIGRSLFLFLFLFVPSLFWFWFRDFEEGPAPFSFFEPTKRTGARLLYQPSGGPAREFHSGKSSFQIPALREEEKRWRPSL